MRYVTSVDGVEMAWNDDGLDALERVHKLAAEYPDLAFKIRDTENPMMVYTLPVREMNSAQRCACMNLCVSIADFLGVPQTCVYPDRTGDMVMMTVESARQLFGHVTDRRDGES